MTIANFLFTRRRLLLVAALTLMLHVLTLDWLGHHVGAGHTTPAPAPPAMLAQLKLDLPAPPKPLPPAPAPLPPRVAKAAPPKPPTPAPPPPLAQLQPAALPAATEADAALAQLPPLAPAAAAPEVAAAPATAPAPAAAAAAAPASLVPVPASMGQRYRVQLPEPARFEYVVKRVDADGTQWNGEAVMAWQQDGQHYKVNLEVGISVLITRINLLVLTSEGSIDDFGLAPDLSTEKRKGRAMTATHFNRNDASTITFSASPRSYPLQPGTQDKASVPFQLGGIARADVNQLSGDIDILVGEDKSADLFRFQLIGQDELDTKMGKLVTWHLARPPRPGSYSSRLDIWLAPSLGWYPVQIRNTEANGALTTQTIASITPNATTEK